MSTTAVRQRVRASSDHGWLETVGRVGLVGRGLLHVIVAWLALLIAHGHGDHRADSQGALGSVAHQPLGRLLVLGVAVGLAAYAVWSLAGVVRDRHHRFMGGARFVVYTGLSVLALSYVIGHAKGGGEKEPDLTARMLHWPGGRLLVIALGIVLIATGIANAWKIRGRKWAAGVDLDRHSLTAQRVLGALAAVGLIARLVAFALVGLWIGKAGWTHNPGEATGLDGALKRLAGSPHGPGLLTLVAIGLIAYGAWCIAMASVEPNQQA